MTALIGRTRERELLDAALARLGSGAAGLVVAVEGEPGIGKSRLLRELSTQAEAAGYRVLGAAASEFEDDLPYAVWTEALEVYVRALGEHGVARLGLADPGVLAAVLAGCGRAVPADRHAIHRALRELLASLAGPRPLVVWLDDVHWADPGSVDALAALIRRPPGGAVLLAIASREGRRPAAFTTALAAAGREDRLTTIRLEPLTEAEAAELVGGDVAAIYGAGGGNPFYLEQLARTQGGSDPAEGARGVRPPLVFSASQGGSDPSASTRGVRPPWSRWSCRRRSPRRSRPSWRSSTRRRG